MYWNGCTLSVFLRTRMMLELKISLSTLSSKFQASWRPSRSPKVYKVGFECSIIWFISFHKRWSATKPRKWLQFFRDNQNYKIDFVKRPHQILFCYYTSCKKGFESKVAVAILLLWNHFFIVLVELSFQIKQQELREKAGIKDDSKIALRKKNAVATHTLKSLNLKYYHHTTLRSVNLLFSKSLLPKVPL